MERTLSPRAQRRLAARQVLSLNQRRTIAIKRDVHEFVVRAGADRFATGFRAVMTDPTAMFGLIRVRRPAERMGSEFEVGERFQGCFSIERAILGALEKRNLERARATAARLLALPGAARFITWVEDTMLSDYAEIEEIVLEPDRDRGERHRLRYRYLDGTPIAGSSVFTIEDLGDDRCLVKQIFEYQEVNGTALATFQRIGLKYHDQVVHMQIHRAAAHVGATVESSTIPAAYGELAH